MSRGMMFAVGGHFSYKTKLDISTSCKTNYTPFHLTPSEDVD